MKKRLVACFFIICLISNSINAFALEPTNYYKGIPYEYTPKEGSIEELYKDIIVTLIYPYIRDEVEKQYGQSLQYDLFDVKFLKIERNEYRSYDFTIKLEIRPFVGAHNTAGIDNITMRISPMKTEVKEFKHIKSFEVAPHLKEYYKDFKL